MTRSRAEWEQYKMRSILKMSFTHHLMNEFEIFKIWFEWA